MLTTIAAYNASFKIEVEGLVDIQKVINLTSINQYLPTSSTSGGVINSSPSLSTLVSYPVTNVYREQSSENIIFPPTFLNGVTNAEVFGTAKYFSNNCWSGTLASNFPSGFSQFSTDGPFFRLNSLIVNGKEVMTDETKEQWISIAPTNSFSTTTSSFNLKGEPVVESTDSGYFSLTQLSVGSITGTKVSPGGTFIWVSSPTESPPASVVVTFTVVCDSLMEGSTKGPVSCPDYMFAGRYWNTPITVELSVTAQLS